MAETVVSFNEMLKRYMPYKLLSDEIIKRDYFLQRVAKDQNWKGGALQVPFVGASASSVSVGALTAEADISEDNFVRGEVAKYAELWGSMVFNQRDLDSHGSEDSFIKILPDRIEVFAQTMKEALSGMLLNGSAFSKVLDTNNGTVDNIKVARPELFQIGQKLVINNTSAERTYYVTKVTVSSDATGLIELSATKTGTASATLHSDEVADNDLIYHPGVLDGSGSVISTMFESLPAQLLAKDEVSGSATGSEKLFGVVKTLYPALQAYNKSGTAVVYDPDKTIVLDAIFDAQNVCRRLGRGNPSEAIMSYRNYASCLKELTSKVTYTSDNSKADRYGWSEINVSGVKGGLKLVAVPELDDANILILDHDSMKLHSNGMIERRTAPDGKQFFETRVPAGYQYIVDHRFYGNLVVSKPSANAIIHDIP